MTTSVMLPYPKFRAYDPTTELPLAGGLLYTYTPNTTTNKTTYSDYARAVPNANPVVLNAEGEASVYLDGIYDLVLKTPGGVTVWTVDDYGDLPSAAAAAAVDIYQGTDLKNGSFEVETVAGTPDSWTVSKWNSSSTIDATTSSHGGQSYKCVSTGAGGASLLSNFIEVPFSAIVEVSWDYKSSVVDVLNKVTVYEYDLNQNAVTNTVIWSESAANATSWTAKYATVTTNASTKYIKIQLTGCDSTDPTTGNTWFDNVGYRVLSQAAVTKAVTPTNVQITGGTQLGSPTGGDKGAGTINSSGHIYYEGVRINRVAQRVEATAYTAYSSHTTILPADDTAPQITEGDQIQSVTITPTSATNRLVIECSIPFIYPPAASQAVAALFQDTTASSLAATLGGAAGGAGVPITIKHEMAAGTTASTTFYLRVGPGAAGTVYVNGNSGSRLLGAVLRCRMSVTEYIV